MSNLFSKMKLSRADFFSLVVIIYCGIFIQSMRLEDLLPFGWDQQRDALVMWDMIKNHHLTMIGPLVADPDAFYLGPLWYYLLLPFYWLTNLHPIAGGYFVATVNVLTGLLFYILFRKNLGMIAFFVSLILATITNKTPYNPILLPILTICFFWTINNAKKNGNAIFLMWTVTAISLQIHFSAIFFLLINCVYFLKDLLQNKRLSKPQLFGILLLGMSFLPLIIFDLRHDFVNSKGFYHYFFEKDRIDYLKKIDIIFMFLRTQAVFGTDFIRTQPILIGFINTILTIVALFIFKSDRFTKLMIGLLFLISGGIYLIYSGNLSEYYFLIPNTISLILVGFLVKKLIDISIKNTFFHIFIISTLVIFITATIHFRFQKLNSQPTNHFLLGNKLEIVRHIIESNGEGKPLAIYYKTRPGEYIGFDYIFKYLGNTPIPISDKVPEYTIMIPSHWENLDPDIVIGDVGIRYPKKK